jgi:predicted  nucleic acid-binding Zn-ribbon protein
MLVEKIKKLLILTQQRAILEKKILGLTADTALCNKTEQELLKKNQSMLQKINLSKKKIALIELEIKTLSNRENDIKRNLLGLTKQKEIDSIKREVLSLQGSREDIEEDLMSEIDVLDDSEKALKTEQPLMLEQTNINNKKKVTIAAFAEETKLDLDPILQEINVEISSLPDSFKKI